MDWTAHAFSFGDIIVFVVLLVVFEVLDETF